jgi:LysM repeat protein
MVPLNVKEEMVYFDKYTIKEGDTFESISNKLNIDIVDLGEVNDFGKVVLKEGYTIKLPNYQKTYIVKEGDTLNSILNHTSRSAEEILSLNIKPNMKLKI